jgi:hypothetical protein
MKRSWRILFCVGGDMNGCELNEVLLRTLPAGTCFELDLVTRRKRGVVLEHLSGSTLVDLNEGPGHYCMDCPVIPHSEERPGGWLVKEERAEMANKQNGTAKKVKDGAYHSGPSPSEVP